jgi:antitoxin component of MazEF toxin-antitoxin module
MRTPNNQWKEIALSPGTQVQVSEKFKIAQTTVSKYRRRLWQELINLPEDVRLEALRSFILKTRGL